MDTIDNFEETKRILLLRSIYVLVSPVFILLAVLACAGTVLTDVPVYTCSTAVPVATSTTLAGTAVPTMQPSATPYIIVPPADFYLGDAVYVGTSQDVNGVRFRLLSVNTYPVSLDEDGEARNAYHWQLEVGNIGSGAYEVFPSAQMVLSSVTTVEGEQNGIWYSSREAGEEIGVMVDHNSYVLESGETRLFNLVTLAPVGQATRLTFYLDPTQTQGNSTITWLNQSNPYCGNEITGL